MHTREGLAGDLRRLGVGEGDTVMLHASVRAVGAVAGGPDEILWALARAVGADGTILMYAGCDGAFDHVGRGVMTAAAERELAEKLPAFDPAAARACREFGVLAEFFRTLPGTVASRQVSSRVTARGRRAEWLTAEHPWDYSYGAGSPFDKFHQLGGKIALLGSDHDQVTFLHYVEHVTPFAGKRVVRYRVPMLEDGVKRWRAVEEFNTGGEGVHPSWSERQFAEIVDAFIAARGMAAVDVGDAPSYLLPARELARHAAAAMVARAQGARP